MAACMMCWACQPKLIHFRVSAAAQQLHAAKETAKAALQQQVCLLSRAWCSLHDAGSSLRSSASSTGCKAGSFALCYAATAARQAISASCLHHISGWTQGAQAQQKPSRSCLVASSKQAPYHSPEHLIK